MGAHSCFSSIQAVSCCSKCSSEGAGTTKLALSQHRMTVCVFAHLIGWVAQVSSHIKARHHRGPQQVVLWQVMKCLNK